MKKTTEGTRNGIPWILFDQLELEDHDFVGGLALLLHSHQKMQDKTAKVRATSCHAGFSYKSPKIKGYKDECLKHRSNDPF